MNISVVVPVFNSPAELSECLDARSAASRKGVEIIVVDDCSTDRTPIVAAAHTQVRVVRMERNSGPAAARNRGASEARGSIIFFVDADVVVALDSIDGVARTFAQDPAVAAVFGSYDAHPAAKGTVSQYRNLLHHFVCAIRSWGGRCLSLGGYVTVTGTTHGATAAGVFMLPILWLTV